MGKRYIFRNCLEESLGLFVQGKVVFKVGASMAKNRGAGGRSSVERGSRVGQRMTTGVEMLACQSC